MPNKVKPIPEGHRTVTPYLAIKNAAEALQFYKKAFGAIERYRLMMPDGRVGHAEIVLSDSIVMLSDEFPEYGGKAPEALGRVASEHASLCGGRRRLSSRRR